eukprot:scaffold21810_cov41-Attheya_sp.AAC.2
MEYMAVTAAYISVTRKHKKSKNGWVSRWNKRHDRLEAWFHALSTIFVLVHTLYICVHYYYVPVAGGVGKVVTEVGSGCGDAFAIVEAADVVPVDFFVPKTGPSVRF